jgi:septal ring-binding cell division protein DamX
MNLRIRSIALLLSASSSAAALAAPPDAGVFAPGVRHVCVPTNDGEGWDCGTEAAPPEDYQAPVPDAPDAPASEPEAAPATASATTEPLASEDETPPPPMFLADPDRLTPYAPIVDEPEIAPDDVSATEAVSPAPAAPLPVDAPAPATVAAPSVEPAIEPAVESTTEPAPVSSVATSEPAAPAIAAAPGAVPLMSALGDAAGFAQLPAQAFTLQLAYAGDPSNFTALVAALALDPASCYALRVRGTNGAMWLLAHGAFADAAAARAAQSALPAAAGLSAQWPRRIGALQSEIAQAQ